MTKHTPGPWLKLDKRGGAREIAASGALPIMAIERETGDTLAFIRVYPCPYFDRAANLQETRERAEADARLVAAAPELLDVVKRFRAACAEYLPPASVQAFCGLFAAADEAIAKADGGA